MSVATVQGRVRAWVRSRHAEEEGMVVLWLLGIGISILMLGGLSVDLWRVFSDRRALVGVADAAAFAGASGLDLDAFRSGSGIRLDPAAANDLAYASLRSQADTPGLDLASAPPVVTVAPDGSSVTVRLRGRVELTLLRLMAPGRDAIDVEVTSTAEPRLGR